MSEGWAGTWLFDSNSFPFFIPDYHVMSNGETKQVWRDVRVNFGDIGGIGWIVEGYDVTQEGTRRGQKNISPLQKVLLCSRNLSELREEMKKL